MAMRSRVPIVILTGFLGSGKTSLLAQWLKAPEFAGAMVIINELGEAGIDDRLVESSSETPVLLDNGCACCAAGEDLSATLERLFWDRLRRNIPAFSRVLIETTGIADPAPILERLARHGLVSERYLVEGVVTVVDARLGPGQIERHPECRAQIEAAQAVILSKTDLASEGEIARAREALAALKPGVKTLTSSRANISAADLLAALAEGEAQCAAVHSGARAVHTPGVTSAFTALPGALDAAALEAALAGIMREYGPALLRLKGIVRLAPGGEPHSVQAMPGAGVEFQRLNPRRGGAGTTGLTIIAQDIEAREIGAAVLSALTAAGGARDMQPRAAHAR